jgi:hypothetical protein
MLYRICTEDKNRSGIEQLATGLLASYTVLEALGSWHEFGGLDRRDCLIFKPGKSIPLLTWIESHKPTEEQHEQQDKIETI